MLAAAGSAVDRGAVVDGAVGEGEGLVAQAVPSAWTAQTTNSGRTVFEPPTTAATIPRPGRIDHAYRFRYLPSVRDSNRSLPWCAPLAVALALGTPADARARPNESRKGASIEVAAERFALGDFVGASAALRAAAGASGDAGVTAGFLLEQAERWCDAAAAYRDASTRCDSCAALPTLRDRAALATAACGGSSPASGRDLENRLGRQSVVVWRKSGLTPSITRKAAREDAMVVAALTAVAYGLQRLKVPSSRHTAVLARFRKRAPALVTGADVARVGAVSGDVVQARAVVRVDVAQILRELRVIAGAEGQELPRVMVVGLETFVGRDGRSKNLRAAVVRTLIERALREAGYDVVAGEQMTKLARDAETLLDPRRDADPDARRLAAEYRAEIILKLHARVRLNGDNGFGGLQSTLTVEARAVDAATGQLLDTQTLRASGPPICADEAQLYDCAARVRGPDLVEKIVQGIPTEARTSTFRVILEGARSYGRQARPFIRLLERLEETSAVRQLSFASGRLELEVEAAASASSLVGKVLDLASQRRALRNLDLRSTRGRELSFRL